MKAKVLTELSRLLHQLGMAGVVSLGVLAGAALFMAFVVQPLEEKNQVLERRAAAVRPAAPGEAAADPSAKVQALYDYLAKPEETTDWLAKLYAIGQATGVQFQSASYRSEKGSGRLERYEIVLPLTGSYTQMRDFLKRSLAEIPVLSVDQVSLKRETRRDGNVQAEVRLTIHRIKEG